MSTLKSACGFSSSSTAKSLVHEGWAVERIFNLSQVHETFITVRLFFFIVTVIIIIITTIISSNNKY
jgi:hypothetical protein